MTLYHDEKAFLEKFKEDIASGKDFTTNDLEEIADRLEEMIEMTSVTTKIIDRLMVNHDKLKSNNKMRIPK